MFVPITQITKDLKNLANNETFNSHLENIKKGRFERITTNPIYKSRLKYTQKLRSYVYNPTLMNSILSNKDLKELFFRTFGYEGQLDFTIYPYAWLRDFSLLNFGKGVYLADNIVLGTNQVSVDQKFITVGPIKIGDRTITDQYVSIGYATTIGKDCILSFRASIGIKCKIGNASKIGAISTIGHGTKLGNHVTVEDNCFIGDLCILEDHVIIPLGTTIPTFSLVTSEGVFNRRSLKRVI